MTTLQGDESEDEERLFGLRKVDGEGSADEDDAFPLSAGEDGEDSANEGEPPPPRGASPQRGEGRRPHPKGQPCH